MSRRTARIAVTAGVLAVIAAAGAAAYGIDLGGDEPAAAASLPPGNAKVTRMTLTETENVTGTLGYGTATMLSARGAAGTVTWLPAEGSIVERGRPVCRRDDHPVPLLYGAIPLYRVLRTGVEGRDVDELERNLSALGYDGFTVDDEYTSATADAVRVWQDDLGVPETGTVEPGAVAVARGPLRVAQLKAAVGDPAGGPLLAYTATTKVVEIALDVSKQHLVHKGVTATVTLPDDSTVAGEVTSVGTVATSQSGTGGETTTTVDVIVAIRDQKALGSLDGAPVSVTLTSDRRENVLTVPVAALLALAEGGYGVQVIDGGQASYVAVTTGLFADGRVEITGDGIAEGTVVGMPG